MSYEAPGVYIRYVTDGPLTIRAASTSTALFVGPTKIGGSVAADNATVTPVEITSIRDYVDHFATRGCSSGAVSLPSLSQNNANPDTFTDHMGLAISGFFANGGTKAYVISTCRDTARAASVKFKTKKGDAEHAYQATAQSAGGWGNDVSVTLSQSASGADFVDVEIALACLSDAGTSSSKKVERFLGVGFDELETVQSSLVKIAKLEAADAGGATFTTNAATPAKNDLDQGSNSTVSSIGYASIFDKAADYDDISLIVTPDLVWKTGDSAKISHGITHAQKMKDRMVLAQTPDDVSDWDTVSLSTTEYLSAYHPRGQIVMNSPAGEALSLTTGLTGHAAGVIARTDADKGAWSAAAGTHADLRGVAALTKSISQVKQGAINRNNVNTFRYIAGIPTIYGARTRDKGGIYEYQPVMRTAFLIADSLRTALEQAIFAKNTEVLWANLKSSVEGFMNGLYTQGAFQGGSPAEAFEVACGLGTTMTQADINAGLLRVVVRFRAAKPAEMIEVVVEQLQ